MTMIGASVSDFGSGLGLELDELGRGGHVALAIRDVGQVHFEHLNEQLLVYMSRPIDVALDRLGVWKAALRAVHVSQRVPVRVQCSLHGDDLVFLARYEEHEVDRPALERALDVLSDLHQKVRT